MTAFDMPSVRKPSPASLALRATAPTLTVRDAFHAYGGRRVLGGVSIDLYPGQIYGLLGPNGAGKTTVMKAMSGYLELDSGYVELQGVSPRADREAKRAISYIPQNVSIYPHLTVAENLQTFGRLCGLSGDELKKRVSWILDLASLEREAKQVCRTLSGGYQRRVNICAGVLGHPAVLILDEPTVGIDLDAREAIHGLLQHFREMGVAIVIATHDLDQAQTLSDRIGFLKNGELILEGVPYDILDTVFGGKQEVAVVLWQQPTERGAEALTKAGMRQTQSPLNWIGFLEPEIADNRQIKTALASAGLDAREIRVREPDLTSLFFDQMS